MPRIDVDALESVTATMNYLADPARRPAYYLYETRPGFTPPPPQMEKCDVPIHDVREHMAELTLDDNGFCFVSAPLPAVDFLDSDAVVRDYYPLCNELVRSCAGAGRVRRSLLSRAHQGHTPDTLRTYPGLGRPSRNSGTARTDLAPSTSTIWSRRGSPLR